MNTPPTAASEAEMLTKHDLPTVDRPFYKPSDVAALLEVDRSTVYRWIDQGLLKAVALPTGTKRVLGPSLQRFLLDHVPE
jgi:excisionase family DNA binding protein